MSKKIQDNNHLYNLLSPLVQFATRCHYRHFVVRGLDNLPTDGAYIIAPCHQQCLMEPLAVLCIAPKPPVFLARADIFAKPTIRAILTFLRILPVYRIRDGKSSLGKNHAIFDQCRDVLLDGYPLCLMAEGRHNNRHQLLPLGKGMFRIAGETQQRLGDYPLYIVPTGIDFDHYERPYSNLVVNIGKPIPVQPFMETYLEDEPVALNQMRDALTAALSPLMLDIRDNDRYDQIYSLCNSLNRDYRHREGLKNTAWNRFLMRQKIAADVESGKLQVDTAKCTSCSPLSTLRSSSCGCGRRRRAGARRTMGAPLLHCLLPDNLHSHASHSKEESRRPAVPQLHQLRCPHGPRHPLCHSHCHSDGRYRRHVDEPSRRHRRLVGPGGPRLGAHRRTPRSAHRMPTAQRLPLQGERRQ